MKYYYLNKKIVPANEAKISVTDIGLQRGYGVFDFTRTFNGIPFLLDEHLKRFTRSAKQLGLHVPYSNAHICKIITQLIKRNGFKEAAVKVGLTGGPLKGTLDFDRHLGTFFVQVDELSELPEDYYTKGIKLLTTEFLREIPTAKTLDYVMAVKEGLRAKKMGALEVLYVHKRKIIEAATSNFFLFKKDVLITPDRDILEGITRNFVIKLAKGKFRIEQRAVRVAELSAATEAFITASKKDILPVVKIDTMTIGTGQPGVNTQYLMSRYSAYLKNEYGYTKQ